MAKDRIKHQAWLKTDASELPAVEELARNYIAYLNEAKTERESARYVERVARGHGFEDLGSKERLKPGDKVYTIFRDKMAAMVVVGRQPLTAGTNIVASHADAPRLDLKPVPLYEDDNLALLKTHYYGGIKKYQWVAMPLALHGVVYREDGTRVDIAIGEQEDDPVFTISDLLPHLAKDQMEKKASEVVTGEALNIIIGSRPDPDVEKDRFVTVVEKILKERYGIEEEDFTSAEIEVVPAFKAREIGLDRGLIGAYGQDDRVSVYTSLRAILEVNDPERTCIAVFSDKEEIGSVGNTGLDTLFLENLMVDLAARMGGVNYAEIRQALANSHALSADVNAAIDPTYEEVFEKRNDSFLGEGVVVTKYSGSRGKSGANDANPEFIAAVRRIFNRNQVAWQVGELGKVDIGGGGTVALYLARYGMEVLDCGVALLGMHSPFEVASKVDVYHAYKGYRAFFMEMGK